MAKFPFLFGGAFIEVGGIEQLNRIISNFPSFSEGLSLRGVGDDYYTFGSIQFPFLFGGTFIEGGPKSTVAKADKQISLPFRRDFH